MIAHPLTPVRYRAFDKNGRPLIGGQVFAYEAGSTTSQKDTYSDRGMGALNTWPVILDDAGSAAIYISGDYFFQVFDAEGNIIEEGDGIADAESIAQALIGGSSEGIAILVQRVTDLEIARDEHTDQINELSDDTSELRSDLDKEVETDRDAAIEAAKNALTAEFEQQLADVIEQFDTKLNKVKIQIDGVYISLNNTNPSIILGYGTWQLTSKGRAIVGLSDSLTDPNWTGTVSSTFGEYSHQLTTPELPEHSVKFYQEYAGARDGFVGTEADKFEQESYQPLGFSSDGVADSTGVQTSRPVGSDEPHNNVQPSMVFAIWRRTA